MNDESMSLIDFVNQPNTIQLYTRSASVLTPMIDSNPYMRFGNTIRGDFAVLYLDHEAMHRFLTGYGAAAAELLPMAFALLGRDSLEASNIMKVQQHPFLDLKGQGTLIGIIDTGIDYTKEAFIHEDGTSKIRFLWDQTIEGNRPSEYLFGTEYTNEQINQALKAEYPFDVVPSVDTVGHGTFLASVAASKQDTEYIGAAPEADLLIVKLRKIHEFFYYFYCIPESQESVFSSVDVMQAIEYMISRAARLGMPLAICIGLGNNMAGHDGFSVIEEYISTVSRLSGICICIAAGNESNAGHHTSGIVREVNSTYNIQIGVPENSNSFMLHIYANTPDRLSVSLRSPVGEVVPRAIARTGSITTTNLILERARTVVSYYFPIAISGVQLIAVRIIFPTPGIWDVTLHGDIIIDGRFNAWLPITGLLSPGIRFLTPDPFTTVTVPSTSNGGITIGAYDDKNNSLYVSSSWGPSRILHQKPDFVAPGVDVSGIYPMGNGKMTGTSVAAAITTGACALFLQWGIVDRNDISLNTNRIRSSLIRGCRREPNVRYPSFEWGFGKLDLLNTFMQFRGVL